MRRYSKWQKKKNYTSQFPGAAGPLLGFRGEVPLTLFCAVAAHRFEQKSWVFVPSLYFVRAWQDCE